MKDEILAPLYDIREAAVSIRRFLEGHTFEDYRAQDLLRSAVERKFEVIGEAMSRIHRISPDVLTRISSHRDIISFRNILAHGYDSIDDRIVWGIISDDLDRLIREVTAMLEGENS